jgi:hypothetical protein
MENLSSICPATNEYCDVRDVAVHAREDWLDAAAHTQGMLTRQERLTNSILGLPLRLGARLIGADLNSGLRKQVEVAQAKAEALEAALEQPCPAVTVDDCSIAERVSQFEVS